jgi:hypothetical protein
VLATMPPGVGPLRVGAGAFIVGFGMGLLNTTFIILIQASVPWAQRGSATASNIFARMLGSTFGAAALGAVLNMSLHSHFNRPGDGLVSLDAVRRMFDGAEGVALPAAQHAALQAALGGGLAHVFVALAVFGTLTMLATWFVPRRAVFAPAADAKAPPHTARR